MAPTPNPQLSPTSPGTIDMKENPSPADLIETLHHTWEVREQEHPLRSNRPILGFLITALRTFLNKLSTKWYVRPLLQQQNKFNYYTLQQMIRLQGFMQEVNAETSLMGQQHAWLIAQGQEQDELVHDLGEIAVQLHLLQKQLAELNSRLDHLEE